MRRARLTICIMGAAALLGVAFWVLDGVLNYFLFRSYLRFMIFEAPANLLDSTLLHVPPYALLARVTFLVACLIGGWLAATLLNRESLALDSLRRSEERLRLALAAAQMGTWEWDIATNEVLWSDEVEAIFRLEPGTFAGTYEAYLQLVHPEDRDRVVQTVTRTVEDMEAGGEYAIVHRLLRPDGEVGWLQARGNVLYDQEGQPTRMVGTMTDITATKQVEERVQRLAEFPRQNPNPVLRISTDGTVLYANEASLPLLDTWGCQIGQRLPERWYELAMEAFSSDSHRQAEAESAGRVFSLTLAPLADASYVNAYGLDITSRKQAEEALRESEKRYRELFNRMGSGVAVYDVVADGTDFILKELNLAGEQIDGSKKEDRIGKSVSDARPDAESSGLIEAFRRVWETGQPEHYPVIVYDNGELAEWREHSIYRLPTGEIVAVFDDVTERQRAEEELAKHREGLKESVAERTAALNASVAEVEQLNRALANLLEDQQVTNRTLAATSARLQEVNQELADFAYVVSHDLKAPLRAITQLADWISTDYAGALDDDGQEYLRLLTGRTKRMHSLIEGILQYSRVGRIKEGERPVDLNQLVRETIETLAPPDHIQVSVGTELPTVVGERTRLGQVFQNLVDNALKYMDKSDGWVRIGCQDEGTHWLFSVADNGPGIEEKYHTKVFQMFQTLAPRDEVESTGVGLALVKKIVEINDGRIWLESTVGEGSAFYFTLPKRGEAHDENV